MVKATSAVCHGRSVSATPLTPSGKHKASEVTTRPDNVTEVGRSTRKLEEERPLVQLKEDQRKTYLRAVCQETFHLPLSLFDLLLRVPRRRNLSIPILSRLYKYPQAVFCEN